MVSAGGVERVLIVGYMRGLGHEKFPAQGKGQLQRYAKTTSSRKKQYLVMWMRSITGRSITGND
jgi:hypothetical protein